MDKLEEENTSLKEQIQILQQRNAIHQEQVHFLQQKLQEKEKGAQQPPSALAEAVVTPSSEGLLALVATEGTLVETQRQVLNQQWETTLQERGNVWGPYKIGCIP